MPNRKKEIWRKKKWKKKIISSSLVWQQHHLLAAFGYGFITALNCKIGCSKPVKVLKWYFSWCVDLTKCYILAVQLEFKEVVGLILSQAKIQYLSTEIVPPVLQCKFHFIYWFIHINLNVPLINVSLNSCLSMSLCQPCDYLATVQCQVAGIRGRSTK